MERCYADILLPLAVEGYLTFEVPDPMADSIVKGQRVVVPLGRNNLYTGVVVAVHNNRPNCKVIKQVVSVVDSAPVVTDSQFQLWRWISQYYLCTEGEVLKAAMSRELLPRGSGSLEVEPIAKNLPEDIYCNITDKEHISDTLKQLSRAKRQVKLLERLAESGGVMLQNELLTEAGDSAALKSLVEKGLITLERKIRQSKWEYRSCNLPQLSTTQQAAFDTINTCSSNHKCALLFGVPGCGKTEVMINLIAKELQQGQDALYLVPEITLSVHLISRFEQVFGDRLIVWHSALGKKARRENYARMARKERESLIVLGTRSALFLPFTQLGMVCVDEEHDSSYKQSDPAPRYNARDLAVMLAHQNSACAVLCSSTPSIESFFNAISGKYTLVEMTERFGQSAQPKVILSDNKVAAKRGERTTQFNKITLEHIRETLDRGNQILIFQNRRGYSSYAICQDCGKVVYCPNCNVSLTQHSDQLRCHYCGYHRPFAAGCPDCSGRLNNRGYGTERIEQELNKNFPQARVVRIDSDSVSSLSDYKSKIETITQENGADIIVGTQMISKGLDIAGIETVVVLDADSLFYSPDFRASERAYQLIVQTAGRAGRRNRQGTVIIQTAQPEDEAILRAASSDYYGMYKSECSQRHDYHYPPFCRLVSIALWGADETLLESDAERIGHDLVREFGQRVLGPEAPPVDRVRNRHCRVFMLKIDIGSAGRVHREKLVKLLESWERLKVKISVDVDPA